MMTHFGQMQWMRRASSGTLASNASVKVSRAHQHGPL
jgi:hypothetical protein